MTSEAARHLIKDTFERPFDKDRFAKFAKNLLNRLDPAPFTYRGNYIFADFRDRIECLERIGKYEDADGKRLDVLVVYLKRDTSLERARATQRKFVAKYLDGSRGNEYKDAALVAFVSPTEADWRFSFIKMEYKLETTPKGKPRVTSEFTPARRYSFLVGENESSHTAQSRLLPILAELDNDPTLTELESAFSVERVTKEFFERYRELFLEVKEALDKLVKSDKAIRADFEEKGVDPVDFSKKLLGQIVFLYFLQKKGWFGVGRNKPWGTGSKSFMRELFAGNHGAYQNFFNDILEPLFYNTLAVERPSDYADRFDCKIPFLNGGLFDALNEYDWVHTDILLPNDLFSNDHKAANGARGTGILDVFDRYNFTVKEDEPLEREVAVDPEMLGKVFENLLEVKDRKSKGTYYTPREIVHYMCQESLIDCLALRLNEKVPRADLSTLVKHGELALENEIRVLSSGKETRDYSFKLPQSIRDHAGEIDGVLDSIRVCDPAVGSGAFLVGMMTEIVRTRQVLSEFLSDQSGHSPYKLKRRAILNTLYGVDIDLGAVEIAKLRLWLSLIVDEDDYKSIQPLPNLDYKIMQGDSLRDEYQGIPLVDESFFQRAEPVSVTQSRLKEEQIELQREYFELHSQGGLKGVKKAEMDKRLKEIEKRLRVIEQPKSNRTGNLQMFGKSEAQTMAERLLQLHEQFVDAYHKSRKKELSEEIESLTWALIEATLKQQGKADRLHAVESFRRTNTRPFFLWRLHFAEVFRESGGFEIVIANPPYVSHDKINDKADLKKRYNSYEPFADIYCFFIELGLHLLTVDGILCFITSNSYLRTTYGQPLRGLLADQSAIRSLINIEDYQVFDAAIVNTAILIAQRNGNGSPPCNVVNTPFTGVDQFEDFVSSKTFQIDQSEFGASSWPLVDQTSLAIRRKMLEAGDTLEARGAKIRLGLATGANHAFVIDEATRKELIKKDPKNRRLIKPILRGREIHRYWFDKPDRYIILAHNGVDVKSEYPVIYEYLKGFGPDFRKRGAQGKHWSNLRACAFLDDFKKPKIVWMELTDSARFALCEDEMYLLNSAYFMIPPEGIDPAFLVGLLNSKAITFFMSLLAATSGMGTLRWINVYVKEFPLPNASKQLQSRIADLVGKIMKINSLSGPSGTSQLEGEIDQIINSLYGFTPEEASFISSAAPNR